MVTERKLSTDHWLTKIKSGIETYIPIYGGFGVAYPPVGYPPPIDPVVVTFQRGDFREEVLFPFGGWRYDLNDGFAVVSEEKSNGGGFPAWLIPVGIGALALLFFIKK